MKVERYDAITIDTSIFRSKSLNLKNGTLLQLVQFRNSEFDFILSEVVTSELLKQMKSAELQAKTKLQNAFGECRRVNLFGKQTRSIELEYRSKSKLLKGTSRKRIDKFIANTGCEVISSDLVRPTDLLSRYLVVKRRLLTKIKESVSSQTQSH